MTKINDLIERIENPELREQLLKEISQDNDQKKFGVISEEHLLALTEDYLNVFVVRPKEDSADIIKLTGYVTNGITDVPKGFSYSKLLQTYINDRVYDEDKESLSKALSVDAVLKSFSGDCDRLEYTYRIKDADGTIHIYAARYSRISKSNEELRLVAAFRNIDSIASVGEKKREEGLHSAYNALSGIFFSLHRVDVQNNTYVDIKTTPVIEQFSVSNDYDVNAERIIRGVSSKWSCDDALKFVERSTLAERMSGKNHISMEFLSYAAELCKLHFFKEDEDEFGRLHHVIFAVEKVDEEKSQAIINALSRDYKNVFWIDLSDGDSRVLKMKGFIGNSVDEKQNQKFSYGKISKEYIATRVHPDDREAMAKEISLEHLREVFKDKDELVGMYRIVVNDEVHHYRYVFFKLANLNAVVAGFRNIDDTIARHIAEEKQQREQEIAYQQMREEQLAIFDTLAQNFKNVYVVNIKNATAKVLKLEDEYSDNRLDGVINSEFPYERFLNAWIDEAVYPDDKNMLKKALSIEHLREVFSSQSEYIGNYRMLVKGQVINYQFSITLMKDKEHLLAGFQNVEAIIREHLEEEKKRRAKEQLYQAQLTEQLQVFDILARNFKNVYLADLEKETAKILKLDKKYEKILRLGGNREFQFAAVLSHWLNNVVCDEDREELSKVFETENVKKLLATQREFTGSYRSIIDGVVHHFQYSMSRIDDVGMKAVLGYQNVDEIVNEHIAQEKKERELEEARLKEMREHAEVISSLSTIYSTIFRADIDTHNYDILNSVSLMGKVAKNKGNFDDVKENILSAFMAPEMQATMREFLDLNTLAERLKSVNTISTEYKNPDDLWFQARFIVKRRDKNGVAKEVLYVARDITSEKVKEFEQQKRLSHALAAAQQASKAKSTFLNSMSHDIRTPMNAIIGFTALAQTHIDDRTQVQDYLAKISTSSTHLLSLINDILDMSRIESGTVKLEEKPIHIPDLLHDLRTMIQGLVNSKNQNLYIDTQDVSHEDVVADRLRLNQIMINIVGNAIKFTPPGGDIIIRLLEKPCSIKHHRTYEFSVKDTGVGMSKEFSKHIFETFTREYSSTVTGVQGTGLGMAITKNIVDLMGGEITVESEEGRGSLFTVTLNLLLANEPVKNEPIPALMGARALVVDDDLNTCRSVSKMLREIKMRPDWTASGREAIVRAQDAADMKDEYKVYIIDYLMPDMNGIETVRRIRKVISEDVPIIVLTAYDWEDFEYEARQAGVTAFVSKPLFMSELRKVLSQSNEEENVKEEEIKHYDYCGKRVLLVEDNELNREIATAILEGAGLKVDTAEDGAEAVDIMYTAAEDRYDLIFMDIQMPKMDGYTATHEIRTFANNKKANIPIVAMTANAFEEDKKKSLEAGMNGHIVKPISIDEIAKVLDRIFEVND